MRRDLDALVPTDKTETEKAAALVALGFPAVEPVLPKILVWLQDLNWPVAQVFAPFLASVGKPLAPYAGLILRTDDEVWKHWILFSVVAKSTSLAHALRPELKRLASAPTKGERDEKIDFLAQEILERLHAK